MIASDHGMHLSACPWAWRDTQSQTKLLEKLNAFINASVTAGIDKPNQHNKAMRQGSLKLLIL
eukprot:3159467-Amphidinium_carterae.1